MALNYTYRYRKIIAVAEDITVYALLKHIKGQCLNPMDVDPRKGALVFWRDAGTEHDHAELKLNQNDYDSFEQWVSELRQENNQILPVVCFTRHDKEGEHKRYCVARSRAPYANEEESYAGVWLPTKAFKANSLCFKSLADPQQSNEKLDDLIQQVNAFLAIYSDWVNGENYSLTVKANVGDKDEQTLIENMFLGSGYNLCSDIARSHITVVLRKMARVKKFNPEVDPVAEVANSADMKVSFISNGDY